MRDERVSHTHTHTQHNVCIVARQIYLYFDERMCVCMCMLRRWWLEAGQTCFRLPGCSCICAHTKLESTTHAHGPRFFRSCEWFPFNRSSIQSNEIDSLCNAACCSVSWLTLGMSARKLYGMLYWIWLNGQRQRAYIELIGGDVQPFHCTIENQ